MPPFSIRLPYPSDNSYQNHYLLHVEVLPFVELIRVRPGPVVIAKDPSDDMFLHSNVTGRAKCIISGDRHLLNLKTYRRIRILPPAEFLSNVIK